MGRRILRSGFAGLVLLCVASHAEAQDATRPLPAVGEPAPTIAASAVLQGSIPVDRITNAGLRGKIAVIDFWASWCAGCIGSVDHMNAVAGEFAGSDEVVFLVLSTDAEDVLRRTLERFPMKAVVALDEGGATTNRFRVNGFPQAVILGRDGRIAAFVNPMDITAEGLRAVQRGEDPGFKHQYFASTEADPDLGWAAAATVSGDETVVSQVVIRRASTEYRALRFRPTPGTIVADGVTLTELLMHAHDRNRFTMESSLSSTDRYRVSVIAAAPDHDQARTLLRGALEQTFHYTMRAERRTMDVLVMRYDASKRSPDLAPDYGATGGMAGRMGFNLDAVSMDFVSDVLGSLIFHKLVIDETGLGGTFRMRSEWPADDPDAAMRALHEIGLVLTPERRVVDVLIVSPGRAAPRRR